jgi:hypothetical protein
VIKWDFFGFKRRRKGYFDQNCKEAVFALRKERVLCLNLLLFSRFVLKVVGFARFCNKTFSELAVLIERQLPSLEASASRGIQKERRTAEDF